MIRRFKFGVSSDEIERMIDTIREHEKNVKAKVGELIKALTAYGVDVAKAQIRELGAVYTGELEESIKGYFNPETNTGFIRAETPYAIYVEFGTGVVGKESAHPEPIDWVYDKNKHGDDGWVYFNDRDGKFHWTNGMKSRPFMYNTVQILERESERIAKEVFGVD